MIPQSLQKQIIDILHTTHFGIEKIKHLLAQQFAGQGWTSTLKNNAETAHHVENTKIKRRK